MSYLFSKNKSNLIFIFISVIIVSNYLLSSSSLNMFNGGILEQENCSQNISIVDRNDLVMKKDIYIIPDFENIICLGKVVNVDKNPDGSKIVFIGSNPKVITILKIFLVILLASILILKKTFLKTISWVGVFGYLFLYLIESPEDSFFQHFYADRSYLLLFLLLINIFNKNLNLFLISLTYFVFIDYNYFGIYILYNIFNK